MHFEVCKDADAVAQQAARYIADAARRAVAARGCFTLAVSGGRTPWEMLRRLAGEDLPWTSMHLFQVDERVAPAHHEARNWTHLVRSLSRNGVPVPAHLYPMPVEAADLGSAADRYALALAEAAGSPPMLDLIHLGLGADGHTASLFAGDPALEVGDSEVTLTGPYQGWRRMTLTMPVLCRARNVLWVVTGEEKAAALRRLRAGDGTIPAGRVARGHALILADEAAAGPKPDAGA